MTGKCRILLIDDDRDLQEVMKAILISHNFDVFTANNSKDGIEAANELKPDLIVCDMMMDAIDSGTKVAEYLRDNHPAIPVFLLSSLAEATARYIDTEQIGFTGVMQKPVKPEVLIKTIEKALGIDSTTCG